LRANGSRERARWQAGSAKQSRTFLRGELDCFGVHAARSEGSTLAAWWARRVCAPLPTLQFPDEMTRGWSNCLSLDRFSRAAGDLPVVPLCRRPARLIPSANQRHIPRHPAPEKEGRIAIVTNVGAGCGGRDHAERRTAWTRGRRSRVVLTPRRWRQPAMMLRITLGWWQESPVHQGEREASRKPFACGNAGLNRWTRGDYARVLCFFRTRGCGCIEHPAFPTPSPRKRLAFVANSRDRDDVRPGWFVHRGNAEVWLKLAIWIESTVHLSLAGEA